MTWLRRRPASVPASVLAVALLLAAVLAAVPVAGCAGPATARRVEALRRELDRDPAQVPAGTATAEATGGTAVDPAPGLGEGLDAEALVALALERNPGLGAAHANWLAALEAAPAAASLPDPRLRVARMVQHVETRLGPTEGQAGLMQAFPFPGKLSLAGQASLDRALAAHAAYEEAAREVAARARRLHARLYYLERAMDVYTQQKALLERFAATAQTKYASGTASQHDVLRAQVEQSVLANRLVSLEQEIQAARAAVNALVDRDPEAPVGLAGSLPDRASPPGSEALYAQARAHRPLLAQRGHELDAADKTARLARMEYLPDFELGAEYTAVGLGDTRPSGAGRDAWGLSLGLRLPLGLGRIRAQVASAEARRHAAARALDEARNRVSWEVKDALVRVENGRREVDLYETSILPVTEQALAVAETDYRDGRVDFLSLINLEKGLEQYRLEYHRTRAGLEEAWADLERAVGGGGGNEE